jgi:resuscitation-promoting factor RpfB
VWPVRFWLSASETPVKGFLSFLGRGKIHFGKFKDKRNELALFDYNFCMQFIKKNAKFVIPGMAGVLLLVLALIFIKPFTKEIKIYVEGQDLPVLVRSSSKTPVEFFKQAGILMKPEDRIVVDGIQVAADKPIENPTASSIQLFKAHKINLNEDGQASEFFSAAPTLGQALWEKNIILRHADVISIPLDASIQDDLKVTIRRSQLIRIQFDGKEIALPVAADTVGDALAQAGVSLQNLDYSLPGDNEALPADRIIKVVRVSEEIKMQTAAIPFTTEYVADNQLGMDSQKLVQAGEYGFKISRIRIRYENGKEVQRKTEAEYIAKAPVVQRYAYGTQANIQTLSTPNGTIEYYRALSVWITSYHDTGSRTASGKWPAYGDVAVRPEWYKALKGSRLYIPGYGVGTITDVCPGCVGKYWIDVFIPTAEYVGWHKTETVYFLTPIPNNPLWVLP